MLFIATEYPQMGQDSLEVVVLSTIPGITIATLFIVEIVKRLTGNVRWLKKTPMFLYVMVIAAALTLLANKVLKTAAGQPMLPGSPFQLVWSSLMSAAGSSGFYTWLRKPASSPEKSAAKRASKLDPA